MFHVLQEVDAEGKVSKLHMSPLMGLISVVAFIIGVIRWSCQETLMQLKCYVKIYLRQVSF